MVLEKAYAKLHHSYKQIISGNPLYPTIIYSGAPTFFHHHDDIQHDRLYDKITEAIDKHELVCTATSKEK